MPERDDSANIAEAVPALRPAREADQARIAEILRATWISAYAPRLPRRSATGFSTKAFPRSMWAPTGNPFTWRSWRPDRRIPHVEGDFVRSLHVDPQMRGKGVDGL